MAFYPVALQFLPLSGGTISGPLTVTGLITGNNGETLTNGNLAVSFGNVTVPLGGVTAAGPLDLQSAGQGLQVKEGANAKQGVATLVAGTVVVADTSVTANSRILLTTQAPGGTAGFLVVSARTAGTSFTILSSNVADTSVVAYEIFEPG